MERRIISEQDAENTQNAQLLNDYQMSGQDKNYMAMQMGLVDPTARSLPPDQIQAVRQQLANGGMFHNPQQQRQNPINMAAVMARGNEFYEPSGTVVGELERMAGVMSAMGIDNSSAYIDPKTGKKAVVPNQFAPQRQMNAGNIGGGYAATSIPMNAVIAQLIPLLKDPASWLPAKSAAAVPALKLAGEKISQILSACGKLAYGRQINPAEPMYSTTDLVGICINMLSNIDSWLPASGLQAKGRIQQLSSQVLPACEKYLRAVQGFIR